MDIKYEMAKRDKKQLSDELEKWKDAESRKSTFYHEQAEKNDLKLEQVKVSHEKQLSEKANRFEAKLRALEEVRRREQLILFL